MCVHTRASVLNQYNTIPNERWWCSAAGKVSASPAKVVAARCVLHVTNVSCQPSVQRLGIISAHKVLKQPQENYYLFIFHPHAESQHFISSVAAQ